MELWSRRKFFLTSLAGSALAGTNKLFGRPPSNEDTELALATLAAPAPGQRPLIISSANGLRALDKGMDILKKGGDTLDAVVAAVTVVEDDPNEIGRASCRERVEGAVGAVVLDKKRGVVGV